MAEAGQRAAFTACANSRVKLETKTEDVRGYYRHQANPKLEVEDEEDELNGREDKPLVAAAVKLQMVSGGHGRAPKKQQQSIIHLNRRRLGRLLSQLAAAHRWREACAVLSTVFAVPRSYSPSEDRRKFLIAMEIQKRFCRKRNYHNLIKSTYEIWLGRLSWHKKGYKKKHLLQLELALFYLSQEKFAEAYSHTRFLVTDECGSEPFINLIHGLILYQLWYADLPEEMQIKGFDVHTLSDALGLPSIDSCQQTEMGESSNGHDAVDIENTQVSSHCSSESSAGNEKIFLQGKNGLSRKKTVDSFTTQDHIGRCLEDDEVRGLPANHNSFSNTSIYFASGLDKSLLPIQLKLLADDPVQATLLYRKLANEKHREAVKHLRHALHSTPPLLAALLPLIQLLLLGDQVHEAIAELDKSCDELDSALPFRLKAGLLQSFSISRISMISSCYENALTRDPACNFSMETLIKMHRTGNYSTTALLEMLAKHLDAVDGKCCIWEEFVSCLIKLQKAMFFHYEDCLSTNIEVIVTDKTYCNRIPMMFTEGETGDTWKVRCRWWVSRHFGRSIYLSEIQAGDRMLLQFKAACATHLYGPNFEYVSAVLNSFTQQGNSSQLSFLHSHVKNPMNLREKLMQL